MSELSAVRLFAWLYCVVARRRTSFSLLSASITHRTSSHRWVHSSAVYKAGARSSELDSRYLMCLDEERLENSSK